MDGPLKGIRILDLSRLLPGPLATMHLADLGAEVIKLESPSRADYLRFLEPYIDGQNIGFSTLNRGKKSVVVAFDTEQGKKLVQDLVKSCDALVESFRPGFLKRYGLDYQTLRSQNPDLIYCSITAFGQQSSAAGHDINCLAVSGLSHSLMGKAEPQVPNAQLADVNCGLAASQAIIAALFARERGAGGTHLDLAMVDAAYHLVLLESVTARAQTGSYHGDLLDGSKPFYRYYRCRDDRYLAVGSVEDRFQKLVLNALDIDDWNQAESAFLTRSSKDWLEVLRPLDCCVEPVLSPDEVLQSEWMLQRFGTWTSPPALLEASFPAKKTACALPGANTLEVLGLDPEEARELREAGVISFL